MSKFRMPALCAAVLLALAPATVVVVTAPAQATGSGRISVVIHGVPKGSHGKVKVTGPGGFHRTLTRSRTLHVGAAGRYRVTASAVTVNGHVAKPGVSKRSFTLKAGHKRRVVVTYSMGWASLSSGHRHTCGVRVDGTAWCWGWRGSGQLGDGKSSGNVTAPEQVGSGHNWLSLSAGTFHTCGVQKNGTAWCWGDNATGELGDDSTKNSRKPVRVPGSSGWTDISAGYAHTCGLKDDGTLWCWGDNSHGQLGDGDQQGEEHSPVQVEGSQHWTTVSAGYADTCALDNAGGAWCWGSGIPILSIGNDIPDPFELTGTWKSVSTSYADICGIHTDQTVGCQGVLPGSAGPDDNWRAVAPGYYHACGIRHDRSVWCFGSGSDGELGNGQTGYSDSPVKTRGKGRYVALTTGDYQTCGIRTNGTAWCWGLNDYGQLGRGNLKNAAVPVRVRG